MRKIIHVTDREDSTSFIKSLLEKEGFKVLTVCTGKECLELLEKEDIDLVLLDIIMPDMTGWEVFKKIKEMKKETKVAFLSMIDISKERKEILFKEGIADYITNSFDEEELIERVKRIVL